MTGACGKSPFIPLARGDECRKNLSVAEASRR
jgi:hypothetical protein